MQKCIILEQSDWSLCSRVMVYCFGSINIVEFRVRNEEFTTVLRSCYENHRGMVSKNVLKLLCDIAMHVHQVV